MTAKRTEINDPGQGLEDKSLKPAEDKTAQPTSETATVPAGDAPTVNVQFAFHHGPYQPGDVAPVDVAVAANLVAQHRATYATS